MKHLTLCLFMMSLSIGAFAQGKPIGKPAKAQFACLPFKVAFDSMKACQKFKSQQPKGACKCSKL